MNSRLVQYLKIINVIYYVNRMSKNTTHDHLSSHTHEKHLLKSNTLS